MHILVILLAAAVIAFILLQRNRKPSAPVSPPATPSIGSSSEFCKNTLTYIADGKLFISDNTGGIAQIESHYVRETKARLEREKKLAGWKEGTTWNTSFAQMRNMGEREEDGEIRFGSVTRLDDNSLLYFLKSFNFGGLFKYDAEQDKEVRILHRQNLHYQDLSAANDDGLVLFATVQTGGNSHIAVIDCDGNQYRELTGGDTIDCGPAWVKGQKDQIVYQSQGLARDPAGYIKGVGPAAINLLNIANGDLKVIFTDDHVDFLKPQVSAAGDLYFIQRPYEPLHAASGNVVMDALLFPFRLLRAVFHYLNFFSMMYSKKPLTSAGGPRMNEDAKTLILRGKRIETEKALKQLQPIQGAPSLVPASWQLIRCKPNGDKSVVATHVASYYISDKDQIIYSNGCGVFYLDEQRGSVKIAQENLIEEVYC